MDWTQCFTVIDETLYVGDRWLGSFSSHEAAFAGLKVMREPNGLPFFEAAPLCDSDLDLLAAIDADEV